MRLIFLRSAQCTLRPGPLLTHDLGADHQREISHIVSLDATHARGLPDNGKKSSTIELRSRGCHFSPAACRT